MKIKNINIHNFRSIIDASIDISEYTLLVGANNAGKSNFLAAIRMFYEDIKWTTADFPKLQTIDQDSWIEVVFELSPEEWDSLAEKYKVGVADRTLKLRRYFKSNDFVKSGQSNIYGYSGGVIEKELFYGAKNVATGKLGQIIYIPAMTTPEDQTKLSGPSPLRDVLNFLLKKIVTGNPAYDALKVAFENLNESAKGDQGIFSAITAPLNSAISDWQISIDLQVNAIKPEDISKNLVSFSFKDSSLGNEAFDLSRYGHGFQRSVIYELIRIAPSFKEVRSTEKKEFNPDLTLILFEEPEAFLHPSKQESMAYHLRRLAKEPGQQIILNTHSSVFAGKAAENIAQIVRLDRNDGRTTCNQASGPTLTGLFAQGGLLIAALQAYINDPAIEDERKKKARKLVDNPPEEEIREAEERFRYQMWLDSERAAMFFADRVLLVEGATERTLFNFLLADRWRDLANYRICVIDVLGKFNMHRYMSLMHAFGIKYGVIIDDDDEKEHQQAINSLVERVSQQADSSILAGPVKIRDCLETFLGLQKTHGREDKKPIEPLKAIADGGITDAKLNELKVLFSQALALPQEP